MRIFIPIFLMIAHFISVIGLYVNIHECGGSLSYSFYGISCNDCCACDHEDEAHLGSKCCKDKKVEIKGKADNATRKYYVTDEIVAVLFCSPVVSFFPYTERLPDAVEPGPRPFYYPPPLYLLYRNIRV